MRKWKQLFIGILALVMIVFTPDLSQAASKVLNNGDDVIQSGDYVYYLASHGDYNGSAYDLCRIKTNNKGKKVLDSWKGAAGALYLSGNKLYYQRGEYIYTSPLSKKAPKQLIKGTLAGVYGSNLYYISGQYNNMDLCVMKTDGSGKKKLLSSYKEIWAAGSQGEKLIVNAEVSSDRMDIVYVNMSKKTAKILTSEGNKNNSDYGAGGALDIYLYKNTLYYACGTIEGTGGFFNGDFKKINLNGTKKTIIDAGICNNSFLVNSDMLLHAAGGSVYYCKDGVKKYSLSKGKVSSVSNSEFFNVAGNYAYTGTGNTGTTVLNISRYRLDEDAKKAETVLTLNKNSNYQYSISDILQVGDYIYIDLDVRCFDNSTGWRGRYMGIETYKMTTSFKNVKKLN